MLLLELRCFLYIYLNWCLLPTRIDIGQCLVEFVIFVGTCLSACPTIWMNDGGAACLLLIAFVIFLLACNFPNYACTMVWMNGAAALKSWWDELEVHYSFFIWLLSCFLLGVLDVAIMGCLNTKGFRRTHCVLCKGSFGLLTGSLCYKIVQFSVR